MCCDLNLGVTPVIATSFNVLFGKSIFGLVTLKGIGCGIFGSKQWLSNVQESLGMLACLLRPESWSKARHCNLIDT